MRQSSHRILGAALAALLTAGVVGADEVVLRNGGRLSGVIVERTETKVTIETGPGRVTLPMSRVERIVESRSALETFSERAAGLGPGDVAGWTELARWAEDQDLLTQARVAWERVLAADPRHPEANAGLGRVSLDGVWMSADDAHRARGYVSYAGRWLTPAEHEAALRERAAEQAAALEAREADMRMREADARAREADARAREAESQADTSGGIPLDYVYGSGYGYGYGYNSGYGYGSGYGTGYGSRSVVAGPYRPGYGAGGGPAYGPQRPGHRHNETAGRDRPGRPARPSHPSTRPATRPTQTPRNQSPRSQAGILPPPPSTPQPTQARKR